MCSSLRNSWQSSVHMELTLLLSSHKLCSPAYVSTMPSPQNTCCTLKSNTPHMGVHIFVNFIVIRATNNTQVQWPNPALTNTRVRVIAQLIPVKAAAREGAKCVGAVSTTVTTRVVVSAFVHIYVEVINRSTRITLKVVRLSVTLLGARVCGSGRPPSIENCFQDDSRAPEGLQPQSQHQTCCTCNG